MIWKKTRVYFLIILVLVIASVGSWYYIKQGSESDEKEESSNYQYQVEEPQLVSYSNGHKRWDIESDTITQPRTDDDDEKVKVILKKIEEGKLYSNQRLEYKVKADEIVYFEKSKDIDLSGDVRLEEVSGDKIFADKLSWNDETKHLKTNSGVRVEMKDGQLEAQNMDLDLERRVIDFTGDVTMSFKVRGAQGDEK
ncbi:MAG: LPS export ABC transporter periplasmic protein LptC [Halanaerobacter sp.]